MDKDRSKKKRKTVWNEAKRCAAELFDPDKPKNQGKEICKVIF